MIAREELQERKKIPDISAARIESLGRQRTTTIIFPSRATVYFKAELLLVGV